MKKVFYLVAASMLMTSCLKDRAIEAYNEDFASVFGDTDPLHTWKMVENQSVEVNVDKPSRVKIYVKAGNAYRLAADYENVSGTRTLAFDAPMGCEDIHVTVDGIPYQGGSSRAESRADSQVGITPTDVYESFTYQTIQGLYNDFRKNGNLLPETENNTDRVEYVDYTFISTGGTYKFYPIYWGGIFHHNYGLYYYNGDNIEHIPFIKDHKASNILQRRDDETGNWVNVSDDYAYDYFFTGGKSYQWSDVVLKSLCYNLHLPKGVQFGFYVEITHQTPNDRGRFYSDPTLNEKSPVSTFAYLQRDGKTYITVEDYNDSDFNDFIFVLEGTPAPVVNDPVKYVYAVEDLGGENDFDFNDVVFSVSHISGHEEAIVQPLAAGGIYPATIYFGNESCGEIHDKFGAKPNVMVNTAKGTTSATMVKASPFKVNVGATWSNTAVSYGNSGNGFKVEVDIPGRVDKKITTYEPGKDIAPQMLVLSENWLWPTERTRISDAYTEFLEWGANYSKTNWDGYYDENNSWISKHTNGLVVNWK